MATSGAMRTTRSASSSGGNAAAEAREAAHSSVIAGTAATRPSTITSRRDGPGLAATGALCARAHRRCRASSRRSLRSDGRPYEKGRPSMSTPGAKSTPLRAASSSPSGDETSTVRTRRGCSPAPVLKRAREVGRQHDRDAARSEQGDRSGDHRGHHGAAEEDAAVHGVFVLRVVSTNQRDDAPRDVLSGS